MKLASIVLANTWLFNTRARARVRPLLPRGVLYNRLNGGARARFPDFPKKKLRQLYQAQVPMDARNEILNAIRASRPPAADLARGAGSWLTLR